jgi:hypothetical protein
VTRLRQTLLLALAGACLWTAGARADGDPASDYLITQQVFYPYYGTVPKAALNQLEATVAEANKKHFAVRVAVITSPYDLGTVSALWQKPEPYALFLAEELGFAYRGRLIVVSPNGYGFNRETLYVDKTFVAKPDPRELALLRTVPIGKGVDGLLQTADKAVRVVAAKAGVKLPVVAATGGGASGSSMDTVVIAIAAAVGALLAVGIEVFRRRRRQRGRSEPERAGT